MLSVQSLTNVVARGGVWGGGEQLWDWKAWRRSVELSKDERRRGMWLTFRMGLPRGAKKGWEENRRCQGSLPN